MNSVPGELRLPEEWGPDYPKDGRGKAMEHYSWRKVTTSVSNFIMGTPIIDHSGDMVRLFQSSLFDIFVRLYLRPDNYESSDWRHMRPYFQAERLERFKLLRNQRSSDGCRRQEDMGYCWAMEQSTGSKKSWGISGRS